ncbi:tripartite tricarboxylate transporter TctB family protein [Chelativorans sp.]|uniref:tripartite tricarboxylate transporter TctB family protein n=1 Tax=Chelativorans sp. TaxID=2203393 RepID=UPI002811CCBD|nr:tripartite tricarboxylate transporter TctB family protein [Chelativorans sp.]
MPNSIPEAPAGGGSDTARPWWLGGLVVALGCLCLYGAFSLPQAARYAGIGPGLFVTLVGGGLVLLGLILLLQIARDEQFIPQDTEDASGGESAHWPAFFTALAAALAPIFTIERLGMPITAMLSFALVAHAFGSRKTVVNVLVGAVLGALSWLLFTRLGLQLGGFLPMAGI